MMEKFAVFFQPVMILLLSGYVLLLVRSKLNSKVILRSAIMIFISGVALYMYGYSLQPEYNQGIVTCLLRSSVGALKMFIYSETVFELVEAQSRPMFLELFYLTLYAALLTSISTVIMVFGKRVITFFTLALRRKPYRHIFLGINEKSRMIASEMENEDVVFIEFPSDVSDDEKSLLSSIQNMSSSDDAEKEWASKTGFTMLKAKRDLSQYQTSGDVFDHMGLSMLRRVVDSNTAFYLLSDDTEKNLNDLMILISDKRLSGNTIHACARREGVARSYQTIMGKTGAHFIYPSSLSVVELLTNPMCHPLSLVDVDRDENGRSLGTVAGEFNAMIVGFGETGQAVAQFLYEFASAVRSDGTPLPVKIYVNDEKLVSLKGQFEFSHPDIGRDDMIVYENFGTESGEFWNALNSRLDKLNFIELSMNEEAFNLELACNILNYAYKKRKNGLKNFRVVIRKKYTPSYERNLINRLNEKFGCNVLFSFGENEKIFTPQMVVSKTMSGINSSATSVADEIDRALEAVTGKSQNKMKDAVTYSEKRTARRDMHQNISRGNFRPSLLFLSGNSTVVSDEVLLNLAKSEHLRYRRYLLAHGYSYDKVDDDAFRTNHQICDWSELSDEDRKYHCDAVRAMLMSISKQLN